MVCIAVLLLFLCSGGDLHQYFTPYEAYLKVDPLFRNEESTFLQGVSLLNLCEATMCAICLLCYMCSRAGSRARNRAVLLGFVASIAMCFKTVLYVAHDHYSAQADETYRAGVPAMDYYTLFLLPNCLWIVFPALLCWSVTKQVLNALHVVNQVVPVKKTQ